MEERELSRDELIEQIKQKDERIYVLRRELWQAEKSFNQLGEITLRDIVHKFLEKDKAGLTEL